MPSDDGDDVKVRLPLREGPLPRADDVEIRRSIEGDELQPESLLQVELLVEPVHPGIHPDDLTVRRVDVAHEPVRRIVVFAVTDEKREVESVEFSRRVRIHPLQLIAHVEVAEEHRELARIPPPQICGEIASFEDDQDPPGCGGLTGRNCREEENGKERESEAA